MVAVGVEELGVQEFVDGKFWAGELYVDTKKQIYKDMKYKRLGFIGAIGSILGKKGRDMIAQAKKEGIDGDLKGDGYQNGGSIIVSKGGEKVLLNFVQENPSDHVPLADVLSALGIEGNASEKDGATASATPKVECQEDVCTIKE